MKTLLRRYTPPAIWNSLRKTKNIVPNLHDAWDSLTGQRDPLMPPRRTFTLVGHRDFKKTGEEFLGHFTRFGLERQHTVLDVGCGIGRMAIPLTRFLTGRYEGFDIVKSEIEWCTKNITPRYPNFHFQLADIFNSAYNPEGKINGDQYRFPYADRTFDFVFLTSVFTHMLETEVANYLREINRVLKPSGRCFATCFLLNDQSEQLIASGRSKLNIIHPVGNCKVLDPLVPTGAVAFPETCMRNMLKDTRLSPLDTQYGSWCGRREFLSYQDVLIVAPAPQS